MAQYAKTRITQRMISALKDIEAIGPDSVDNYLPPELRAKINAGENIRATFTRDLGEGNGIEYPSEKEMSNKK